MKATLEEEDVGMQEGFLRLKAHVGDNYLVSNLAVIDRTFHLFSEVLCHVRGADMSQGCVVPTSCTVQWAERCLL